MMLFKEAKSLFLPINFLREFRSCLDWTLRYNRAHYIHHLFISWQLDSYCLSQAELICYILATFFTSRWSTCPLVFGCWEISHVIFHKLRKKELLAKLRKFTKWQLVSLKMVLGCLFEWKWLSFCEFSQICKQLFLSQLKINHVIQEPTAKN